MSNYHNDDKRYAIDLEAALDTNALSYSIGLPAWWNDTEESDIKLVALYRARLIEKLERQLSAATGRPAWVNRKMA